MFNIIKPFIGPVLKRYLPIITIPFAIVIGVIGYNLENILSDKYTPTIPSAKEQREERLLKENQEIGPVEAKKLIPKTIFDKNLSPSLQEDDTRGKKNKA